MDLFSSIYLNSATATLKPRTFFHSHVLSNTAFTSLEVALPVADSVTLFVHRRGGFGHLRCEDCRNNKESWFISLSSGGTEHGIGRRVLMPLENKRCSCSPMTSMRDRVADFSCVAVPMLMPAEVDGMKLAYLFFSELYKLSLVFLSFTFFFLLPS